MKKVFSAVMFLLLLMSLGSCKKEEGEGGTCTITGKVYVKDYNSDLTELKEEYYGPDEDVYIIYGSDNIYSDIFKTNYDGSYRFKYLRPGTYTVYALSKNLADPGSNKLIPVSKTIEIGKKGETVSVDDLVIIK